MYRVMSVLRSSLFVVKPIQHRNKRHLCTEVLIILTLIKTSLKETKAMLFSVTLLLSIQTAANAEQELPPLTPTQAQHFSQAQAQQLSQDLVESESQEFFRQGKERLQKEIQILEQRRLSSTQPILKIDEEPQVDNNRLPKK